MKETYTANSRLHLAGNLFLMAGTSLATAFVAWTALDVSRAWRIAICSASALAAWCVGHWVFPRLVGPLVERAFGEPDHLRGE